MAILNQKRILNLIPKISVPVTLHVSQGDVGTTIEFTLLKGDEVFSATNNLTASVHGIREDGANFGPFTCTLSGSKVTFPLHSEMTAVKGSALAEIVLADNSGNKVGSANFGILVEGSVFPLGVTYDNDVSVYESILAYTQASAAQLINSLNNEISTRISADTFMNTRIDEIIAPSGEAPSAAEVTDARIGVDGTTYDNLGNAIRGQVRPLNDMKTSLIEMNYIAVEPTFIQMQHLQINNSGGVTENANYDSYSYNLNGLTSFRVRGEVNAYAFFSSTPQAGDTAVNGTRYTSIPDGGIINVPTGGKYVLLRLNTGKDAPSTFNVNEDELIYKVVADIKESIGVYKEPESGVNYGVYVSRNGVITQNSSFDTVVPFYCEVGDVIEMIGKGYGTSVSMISKTNNAFTTAEALVISLDATERKYSYIVAENGYYTCSYDNRTNHSITLFKYYSSQVASANQLKGKSISSCGDSVAYGVGYTDGYVKIISDENGMTYNNYGHSGWTMATNGRGDGICTVVETMESADFILIEGGINDYANDIPLGQITNNGTDTVDTDTFYGALEYAVRMALKTFVGSKIIFIITHKRKDGYYTPNGIGKTENDYWNAERDVCEKYGIKIADVNRDSGLYTEYTAYRAYTYENDGTHPTFEGYKKFYVPIIESAMKDII